MRAWHAVVLSVAGAALCTACAPAASPLTLPDGAAAVCASVLPDRSEPYWFGIPVTNRTDRTVVLERIELDKSEGLQLVDAVAVPPLRTADGGTLGIGAVHDPAETEPDVWAGRQALDGFRLEPGVHVDIAVALTRAAGTEMGRSRSQFVTFHLDGELITRRASSRFEITLAPDCDPGDS